MASAPLVTVTELLFEASGRPKGSPPGWPAAIRAALQPCDVAAVGPVFSAGGPAFIPDCLLPVPEQFSSRFTDEVDRVASTDPDQLEAELIAAGVLDTGWDLVARSPRRWLHAYATALRRVWPAAQPIWDRGIPLVEREVERIGTALAQGAFDHALPGMRPDGDSERSRLVLGAAELALAPEIVLVPMCIGPRSSVVATTNDAVSYFAYPVPGLRRAFDSREKARGTDALSALLGAPRAHILRLLDRPTTAGQVATCLSYAPSAITHHMTALERAGLVTRVRQGRHVVVRRSARGTALLHLYEG